MVILFRIPTEWKAGLPITVSVFAQGDSDQSPAGAGRRCSWEHYGQECVFMFVSLYSFFFVVVIISLFTFRFGCKVERQRQSSPIHWFTPPKSVQQSQSWVRSKPGAQTSIRVSLRVAKTITYCLLGCTFAGSWHRSKAVRTGSQALRYDIQVF